MADPTTNGSSAPKHSEAQRRRWREDSQRKRDAKKQEGKQYKRGPYKTKKKQSREQVENRVAAIKARKAAEKADPGRYDAIIYLQHAIAYIEEHNMRRDKAHLLAELALKSLQGE